MNKEQRIHFKAIVILVGSIVLLLLAIMQLKNLTGNVQKEGQYMPLYQVELLVETVEPGTLSKLELFQNLEELFLQRPKEEIFLTYEQYLQLYQALQGAEKGYPLFEQEYSPEHFVTREDFEAWYELFLRDYDEEKNMTVLTTTVIGDKSNCAYYNGALFEEVHVLTTEGVFEVADEAIKKTKFQTAQHYCYKGKLITVKHTLDEPFEMHNIWIVETGSNAGIRFFLNDCEVTIPPEQVDAGVEKNVMREQIADLSFENGMLVYGVSKTEKVNGKIMSLKEDSIEIAGHGTFSLADEFKVYQLYGTLQEKQKSDLIIGYDFTDFVMEDGKVCAALVVKEETMQHIRVLLKDSGFAGYVHDTVKVTCDTDFTVSYLDHGAEKTEQYKTGESVEFTPDSACFSEGRVVISPDVLSGKVQLQHMTRSQGVPQYRGTIELTSDEGNIYIVNEVLLEEYLYSVVPSEMPASYPIEALKAQAVCARTYAYGKMLHTPLAWYGAHVDDSTSYQVYNNIAEKSETTKAVKETTGKLLAYGEELVGAYYYSTSCGFGTTAEVWKGGAGEIAYLQAKPIGMASTDYSPQELSEEENFLQFITTDLEGNFESEESWYRWTYQVESVDCSALEERIQSRYNANPDLILTQNDAGEYERNEPEKLGELQDIYVEKRLPGGAVDELILVFEKATMKVISEYNVRYILNNGKAEVVRKDGSSVASPTLLPSGFFAISVQKDGAVTGYHLTGGGYGHGVGMSQNGAKQMAKAGCTYEDILTFFYDGSRVFSTNENGE